MRQPHYIIIILTMINPWAIVLFAFTQSSVDFWNFFVFKHGYITTSMCRKCLIDAVTSFLLLSKLELNCGMYAHCAYERFVERLDYFLSQNNGSQKCEINTIKGWNRWSANPQKFQIQSVENERWFQFFFCLNGSVKTQKRYCEVTACKRKIQAISSIKSDQCLCCDI